MLEAILAGIGAARAIMNFVTEQVQLAKQSGKFTPEQLEEIDRAGREADENWDARVEAAKARIAARE